MPGTVVILGAGATKACAGPMTNEILPEVLVNKASLPSAAALGELELFLLEQFHVGLGTPKDEYPGLPLLMSLIDMAIDRRETFHPQWNLERIGRLRHTVESAIFDLLEWRLEKAPTNNHFTLLNKLYPPPNEPQVISLNYDLIADVAIMFTAQHRPGSGPPERFPDYCCDISTGPYRDAPSRFGRLLKLHGSLNWLYCRTCHRLDMGASESRLYVKALTKLVGEGHSLEKFYTSAGSDCPACGTTLRALLVAPSHLKDYRNPHVTQIWYRAEQALRDADRAVFIGYSLPDDDVEVVYLLKRSLAHLSPTQITVVDYDAANPGIALNNHPVGRRYRTLFGDGIAWFAGGLDGWLAQA
jgi:hypothetical protein